MGPEDLQDPATEPSVPLPAPPWTAPAADAPVEEPSPPPRRRIAIGAALVAVVLVIAVAAYVLIDGPGGGGSTALALSFHQGQTQRFHMTMDMKGTVTLAGSSQPVDISLSTGVEWRTTAVDASGTATVEESFSNQQLTVNGSPTTTTLPSITLRITTDGRVLSSNGSVIASGAAGGPAQLGGDNVSAILPSGTVSPGDTWTKTLDPTLFGQTLHYRVSGRYLRDEQMAGVTAAVVETTSSIPMDFTIKLADVAGALGIPTSSLPPDASFSYGGRMTARATSWIDASAQRILKTETSSRYSLTLTMNGLPKSQFPAGAMSMSGTMSMSLDFT